MCVLGPESWHFFGRNLSLRSTKMFRMFTNNHGLTQFLKSEAPIDLQH